MNFLLVKHWPAKLSAHGRFVAQFQSGVRLLSSANDGAKKPLAYNNGTVNKFNEVKKKSSAYEPALSIYPHKIDFEKLAADRAKKLAENAKSSTPIAQTSASAVLPVKESGKLVVGTEVGKCSVQGNIQSTTKIVLEQVETKIAPKSDFKNLNETPKPSADKGKSIDSRSKKKVKGKNDAQKTENVKIAARNGKNAPEAYKKDEIVKASALKEDKTLLKPEKVPKSNEKDANVDKIVSVSSEKVEKDAENAEKVAEKADNIAGKAKKVAEKDSEVKIINPKLKQLDKIDSRVVASLTERAEKAKPIKLVEPTESAGSKSIHKQSVNSALSTIPKAKPIVFCPINTAPISGRSTKFASDNEILNKSSGVRSLEASSREIFLRQCNLRSEFSTSTKQQNSGNQSSSSSNAPPPPPPPPSPPSSSNQFLWIGAAAAMLLGGGFYLTSSSKSDKQPSSKVEKPAEAPAAPQKPKVPLTSADIPKDVPYLLIGGGTASFAAFRAIKSHDPKARVMVLSKEAETPYMRPPLSKELWLAAEAANEKSARAKETADTEALKFKQWNGVERSLYYEPNDFYIHPSKLLSEPNGGVAIVRGYTVDRIDVQNRVAILSDGTEIKYGKCLIATGSTPKNLDVFESAPANIKERISLFKTIEDFGNLRRNVDNSKSVAIVGGGFLGSELACALAKYGESKKLEIYQVFHEKGNMGKVLPEYLSEWATERVREEGVNVIPNTEVQGVELAANNQLKLKLVNGEAITCDHVIVAVGSQPNEELGRKSGLEVDAVHGGYLVNAELAARNHVYVAGDAACFYDPQLGRRRVEHHDHAVVSGRLAGENMFGLNKPFTHQSMFWSDLGAKVGYEAIGVVDAALQTVSVFAVRNDIDEAATIQPSVQAASNASDTTEKKDDFSKGVVFYLRDDKIVGIVLWNVFNRINTARAVISQDKKYDDLNEVAKLFDIHT